MTTPNRKAPPIFSWTPRPWQMQVLDGQRKTTAVRCSRRAGKTSLSCYIAGSALLAGDRRVDICLASFALNNAKRVLFGQLLEMLSPLPTYIEHRRSEDIIINRSTGSTVQLFGLSSEHGHKIRGTSFDLAILDEYPLVDYDVFTRAFMPTLLDRDGWLFLIGTPSGNFDLMSLVEADCLDSANEGTHRLFHFPASALVGQIPHLTPEFLERERRRDPLAFELEFEARIEAAGLDTIFTQELLNTATTDEPPAQARDLPTSAGLDFGVARDRSVFCVRNGRHLIDLVELDYNRDPRGFVDEVYRLVQRYQVRALAFDKNGCGEVMADLLERRLSSSHTLEDFRGVGNEAPYSDKYRNIRAELFSHLRDFLAHPGSISRQLPHYQRLVGDLSAVTRVFNDSGKFQLASKIDIRQKIGRSPDTADAVALSMYFERYLDGWTRPAAELTNGDISKMTNREILDAFAEYYQ